MLINYFLIVLSGFLWGLFLIFLLRKIALRYNLLISEGIPLVGGITIGLSFAIVCWMGFSIFKNPSNSAKGIIGSSFIMLVFGLIDDWRELSIWAKFLIQIIATSFLISFGVRTHIIYIGQALNIIITFIWVIGITNAVNHLDVMDGLAGGVALTVSSAFFIISIFNNDFNSAILSLALAGSTLGFLIHNLPPAKVYMGNSGSHFLGFTLAAIALVISYAPLERKIALLSPLIILGLPIFDTAFLVMIRISKKRLPFKKSNDHPALRFLRLGYSKPEALKIMLGACLFFSIAGILISQVSNYWCIIIIVFISLASLIITNKITKVMVND